MEVAVATAHGPWPWPRLWLTGPWHKATGDNTPAEPRLAMASTMAMAMEVAMAMAHVPWPWPRLWPTGPWQKATRDSTPAEPPVRFFSTDIGRSRGIIPYVAPEQPCVKDLKSAMHMRHITHGFKTRCKGQGKLLCIKRLRDQDKTPRVKAKKKGTRKFLGRAGGAQKVDDSSIKTARLHQKLHGQGSILETVVKQRGEAFWGCGFFYINNQVHPKKSFTPVFDERFSQCAPPMNIW